MKKIALILFFPLLLTAQWHPVRITWSNGSITSGEISPMGAKPLTLAPEGKVRSSFQKFSLKDILVITQKTENASMQKPWSYKENGKAEKVFFDGEYPLFNFKTEILTVSGNVSRGHIIAFPMRFKGKGAKKIFLNRQIKGTEKQKLSDIVYVEKIEFTANKPQKAVVIQGRITGFGKVEMIRALDLERGVVHEAKTAPNGHFSFLPLLPGKYELTILTETHVLTGFHGTEKIPEKLQKNFKLANDFFNDRQILLLNGTRTLVYKRRSEFYDAEKIVKGGYVWHLEQWNWHSPEGEWKLDTRNMLIRKKQFPSENKRKIFSVKKLSGLTGSMIVITPDLPMEALGPAY